MNTNKLDAIYEASGDEELRSAYDDWAGEYDQDLKARGYMTPGRLAQALARALPEKDARILDYACGTGLSGVALAGEGFSKIDGADISQNMLDQAQARGVYGKLICVEPNEPPPAQIASYRAITAAGAISKGAAPPAVYTQLVELMQPGALLAVSLNDLSLADPEYNTLIADSIASARVKLISQEHGPHFTSYEKNGGSTIYVLERM